MDNINPKGLPIDSVEGRKYIVQRTNTLTLGMTRADLQQGLKGGVAGLAFQFQSYPLRAIDAIFLPSKGLSSAERTRLALGYLVLAGSAGSPQRRPRSGRAHWTQPCGSPSRSDRRANADPFGSPRRINLIWNQRAGSGRFASPSF